MRYRLRTLLILLAVAPPLASIGYRQIVSHMAWRHRLEGPWIRQAKFLGNRSFSDKKLAKVTGIDKSVRLNAYTAAELLRKLQAFYLEHGYPQAKITLLEGDQPRDRSLAFQIAEGQKKSP
jgi:outer membrane protein assembly factor BamA